MILNLLLLLFVIFVFAVYIIFSRNEINVLAKVLKDNAFDYINSLNEKDEKIAELCSKINEINKVDTSESPFIVRVLSDINMKEYVMKVVYKNNKTAVSGDWTNRKNAVKLAKIFSEALKCECIIED